MLGCFILKMQPSILARETHAHKRSSAAPETKFPLRRPRTGSKVATMSHLFSSSGGSGRAVPRIFANLEALVLFLADPFGRNSIRRLGLKGVIGGVHAIQAECRTLLGSGPISQNVSFCDSVQLMRKFHANDLRKRNSEATSNARPLPDPMSTNANVFGCIGMESISRMSQADVAS
jgi:hypothetical protein